MTATRYAVQDRLKFTATDINHVDWRKLIDNKPVLLIAAFVFHDFANLQDDITRLVADLPDNTRLIIADLVSDGITSGLEILHPFALSITAYHYRVGISVPSIDQ